MFLFRTTPLVIGHLQEDSREPCSHCDFSCLERSQLGPPQASYNFQLLRHSQLKEFRPGIAMRVICKALICKHGAVYLFDTVHIIYINKGLTNKHVVLSLFWNHVGEGRKS